MTVICWLSSRDHLAVATWSGAIPGRLTTYLDPAITCHQHAEFFAQFCRQICRRGWGDPGCGCFAFFRSGACTLLVRLRE